MGCRFVSEGSVIRTLEYLDRSDPMPSAIHHLMELTAARSHIGPGTIVCVDEYEVGEQRGGKDLLLDMIQRGRAAAVNKTRHGGWY